MQPIVAAPVVNKGETERKKEPKIIKVNRDDEDEEEEVKLEEEKEKHENISDMESNENQFVIKQTKYDLKAISIKNGTEKWNIK